MWYYSRCKIVLKKAQFKWELNCSNLKQYKNVHNRQNNSKNSLMQPRKPVNLSSSLGIIWWII